MGERGGGGRQVRDRRIKKKHAHRLKKHMGRLIFLSRDFLHVGHTHTQQVQIVVLLLLVLNSFSSNTVKGVVDVGILPQSKRQICTAGLREGL